MASITFSWPHGGSSVSLATSFNRWHITPMTKLPNGTFTLTVTSIPSGHHQYKFVVDGTWCHDVLEDTVDDNHGGLNNLLLIDSNKPQNQKAASTVPSSSLSPSPVATATATAASAASAAATATTAADSGSGPTGELDFQSKFKLVRSIGEECVSEPELTNLLQKKPNFILYDGFEPSGRMHIAQGVFKAMNVNKATKAGGTFIFWVADWFALMNDKMGGDLDKIKTVGNYLIEVWKAVGMDMTRVKFLWSSEEINKHAEQYWTQALDIARRFTLSRVTKCCQIMGRLENKLTAAQILYPIMQCTDIFFLKADICQLGVDQRKVNMLARDYCDAAGLKLKPIILSHHMLYGLKRGQQKMSKSDPLSAIFMEDTDEEIQDKIQRAYCPLVPEPVEAPSSEESIRLEEDELMNPCLDYVKHVIFSVPDATFSVAGETFDSFKKVEEALLSQQISESDLKRSLIEAISALIRPVRNHFENDPEAKELLTKVKVAKETPSGSGRFRHLSINKTKEPWVVFAPLASAQFDLDVLVNLSNELRVPPSDSEIILWLPDWSSFTRNCLGGDKKAIAASYNLLVSALKATIPDVMKNITVITQSEAILTNPSDYWISVINVGRKFTLARVLAVDQNDSQASLVVASLLHVADVLATGAAHIVFSSNRALHELTIDYYGVQPVPPTSHSDGLPTPVLHEIQPSHLHLRTPSEIHDPDSFLLPLLDTTSDVSRKLKKAFCEPTNIDFCPPLSLTKSILLPTFHKLSIKRKPQDGGDIEYTDIDTIYDDFGKGALHPGDLKPVLTKLVEEFFEKIRQLQKSDNSTKTALTTIKNFLKKKK